MSLKRYCTLIFSDFIKHIRNFSWESRSVKIAIKSALACVLSVLVAYYLELNMVLYAGMSSIIMSEANMGATFKKGLCRAGGTLIGYFLSIFIFGLFQQNHFLFTLSVIFIATICYYKYACSEYAYFWFLIVVTFMIITVDGFSLKDQSDVVYIAFNRTFTVMVGIIVTFIVHIFVWPLFATNDLVVSHSKMRKTGFKIVKEILHVYFNCDKGSDDKVNQLIEEFRVRFKKYMTLKESSSIEKRNCKEFFFRLTTEAMRLNECVENCISFYASFKKHYPVTFQKKFIRIYGDIDTYISELYRIIINFNDNKLDTLHGKLEEVTKKYEVKYRKECRLGHHKSYTVADVFMVNEAFMLINELFELYFSLLSVERLFSETAAVNIKKRANSSFKEVKFFGYNFIINIPALKYGIRTSISLVAVIWLWWYLEFPQGKGGINIVIAIVTICNPDVIYTNIKSLQRLIGCSIGAGLGFLYLSFQNTSTIVFLCCLFVAIFFGAYVKCGSKNSSYIGLQISLAYLVATTHDYIQVTDVVGISFRLVGILIGITVGWIIGQFLFVEDYVSKMRIQINDYSETIKEFLFKNRKEFNKSYEIGELKSIKYLADNLNEAQKITEKDFLDIEKWYILNRRLVYAIYEICNTDEQALSFVKKIKPDVFKNIERAIQLFGNHTINDKDETLRIIEKTKEDIEEIKFVIRKEALMLNMEMDEKRKNSHFILCLRRLVARLDDIYNHCSYNRIFFT